MSDITIGINVQWDNQKQMEKARKDLLNLGNNALANASKFGKTDKEIQSAFKNMLPSINTASKALKVFSQEGYKAWVDYQKEIDIATKGQSSALATQSRNLAKGFEVVAKTVGATKEDLTSYIGKIRQVSEEHEKVILANKRVASSFSSNDFLALVNKNKIATEKWANSTVAVSQAMSDISKKGAKLEFANTTGKYTADLEKLRLEYDKLNKELNTTNLGKFNTMLNQQFSHTESLSDSLTALREKYKTLDTVIKSTISSGDTRNLSYYQAELKKTASSLDRLETLSKKFDKEGFFTNLNKNTKVVEEMDGKLASVNSRMKMLRTTIMKLTDSGNANESEMRELREEYAKVSAEQKKLQKETNGTADRIKNLIKSFVSAQAIVWAIRTVFTKLINVLKDSAAAAAKAEETMNLFEVVFEGVSKSAQTMATSMAKSFGVANSSIREGLSVLGDFSEGLGMSNNAALEFSNRLTSRTMDVVSFKNIMGDTTEILRNLSSGLAGNTENFRAWGYVIKESSVKLWLAKNNMEKLTGTALELAKVQARAAIFMEQSSNAAGDMARTFDSTVNVSRRLTEANKQLGENLGVGINELVTPVKRGFLDLVNQWNLATEAKKAYAEIDPFAKDTTLDTKSLDNTVSTYLKAAGSQELNKTVAGSVTARATALIDAITNISPVKGLIDKTSLSSYTSAIGTLGFDKLDILIKGANASIDDVVGSLDRLGVAYDKQAIVLLKRIDEEKASTEQAKKNRQALKEFGESLNEWSLLSQGGLYSSVSDNLKAQITVLQTALGTSPDNASLAGQWQDKLETIIESASNTLIQAQNEGNEVLEATAQDIIDQSVSQWKKAQAVIDEQAKVAKLEKDNADALKTAIDKFKNAISTLTSSINASLKMLSDLSIENKVSASMLGQDSSIVSVAQQRAKALFSARDENKTAQQAFEALHNASSGSYQRLRESNIPQSVKEKVGGFSEYMDMIQKQEDNIKLINIYFDRQIDITKFNLAYTTAMGDANADTLRNLQLQYDISLINLKAQKERGDITQEEFDNSKTILRYQLDTARTAQGLADTLKSSAFKDSLKALSNIGKKTSIGGYFSDAATTRDASMDTASDEYNKALLNAKYFYEKDVAKVMYENTKKGIEDAYDSDRLQTVLSNTGVSSGFGMPLISDIMDIMNQGSNKEGVSSLGQGLTSLGEIVLTVLSQFDSFKEVLDIVNDAIQELAPIIKSFLAPLLTLLEPIVTLLKVLLLPTLEILLPIIKSIALILNVLVSVISTVLVWLKAFGGVLKDLVTFNWGHIGKNFSDATKQTTDIWTTFNKNAKLISDITLDTANNLKSANTEYIKAIDDMLKSGILTGQEALQLVAKNAGTTYTGNNMVSLSKDAYTRTTPTTNTVNVGTITIDAKNKTMEQIMEELRQLGYEESITGGVAG